MNKVKKRKSHQLFLYIALLSIALGLFAVTQPFISPEPDYQKLDEKDVMGSLGKEWMFHGRYVAKEYVLISMEGERYYVDGKYDVNELETALAEHQTAHIRHFGRAIKELSVEGKVVVAYVDNRNVNKVIALVLAFIFVLFGCGFLLLYRFFVKNEARKVEMRRRRIEKKYGSK